MSNGSVTSPSSGGFAALIRSTGEQYAVALAILACACFLGLADTAWAYDLSFILLFSGRKVTCLDLSSSDLGAGVGSWLDHVPDLCAGLAEDLAVLFGCSVAFGILAFNLCIS